MKQSDSTDTITLILEIVFGFFGILGTGWLYAGNVAVGIAALIGYLILIAVETVGAVLTCGAAACLVIPLNIAIVVISGIKARDYVRNTGAQGNAVYLILGVVGGIVLLCVGAAALTLFFGGLGALMDSVSSGM
jgi:hypothetical protein